MKKRPVIVGICGGTGSGKTTITRRLVEAISEANAVVIEQDNYYKDHPELSPEERDALNFDHPDAVDFRLLADHVGELREGRAVARPTYDFTSHRRRNETTEIAPQPVVLLEGILIFQHKRLRDLMDLKLFVDADADLRFIRRLERDMKERGRTPESVIAQYAATVRPMHREFVEPSRRFVDLVISGDGENEAEIRVVIRRIEALMKGERQKRQRKSPGHVGMRRKK